MIFEVLEIVKTELDHYLFQDEAEGAVILENIAGLDSEGASEIKDKVVLSLLNLQEEKTLKNFTNNDSDGDKSTYRHPKVNLNLFFMVCANRSTYKTALRNISKVVEFFQSKKVFTQANSVYERDGNLMEQILDFRFSVELFTPSFEELNYIWGMFGGKQIPAVFYKLSLIEIESPRISAEGDLISNINRAYKQF
ncbi:DUF4255 domain-containing protein [Cytophagaceae bacterium ABcell3]|nr:DUF4255 domain-containing protein [Cytophagaceae bacterium ABcell3]